MHAGRCVHVAARRYGDAVPAEPLAAFAVRFMREKIERSLEFNDLVR